jgi:outer membrane lipoprotein-sorting protein
MSCRFATRGIFLLALIVPLCGCLFHSRRVERQVSDVPLRAATQQELIEKIDDQAAKVKTLQATVDIDTSVGGAKKGKITDYKEIRGYILVRKPAMLRMIGLMPIVRNKAFDMVSDGKEFKIWIPGKNRYFIGRNDVENMTPKSPLESIRPQDIYEALLIHSVDPEKEIAVLENGFETVLDSKRHRVDQPDYEIVVIRQGKQGWYLNRKVVFSRTDLMPHRQLIYGEDGALQTEAHYEQYEDHDGVLFPRVIEILRPLEEYDITLSMVKVETNKRLTDDQFQLPVPTGAEVVRLDQPSNGGQPAPTSSSASHR